MDFLGKAPCTCVEDPGKVRHAEAGELLEILHGLLDVPLQGEGKQPDLGRGPPPSPPLAVAVRICVGVCVGIRVGVVVVVIVVVVDDVDDADGGPGG